MRGKCKCDMAHNSYKINDVEKMFLGGYTSIHTAKTDFWTTSMKCLPMGEGELIWHAISLHPLSVRNMHRQKICENINMKTDIALSICRCVIKTVKKCTFHMPHNC